MRLFFGFIFIFFLSCSTTKQLNKKWVGKTDQDVVNEFGLPKKVLNDTSNGKVYYYEIFNSSRNIYTKSNIVSLKYVSPGVVENPKGYHPIFETTSFYFDSLNKVRYVGCKDSIIKETIYKIKSGKAF
jgi:hypothetical protein